MRSLSLDIDYGGISNLGYDVVKEEIFTASHPSVFRWANALAMRMSAKQIFERFEKKAPGNSLAKAVIVTREWHKFSELMPWFLCQAAARVSTNRIRHYVIQTAFEELGARNSGEIHHELFLNAAREAGIPIETASCVCEEALSFLREKLDSVKSDARLLGLLLGLEIPARENIETVFNALSFNETAKDTLNNTKFFQLHRFLELEHIRLNVSILLRFCQTDEQGTEYIRGFDDGLEFWERFWMDIGEAIRSRSI